MVGAIGAIDDSLHLIDDLIFLINHPILTIYNPISRIVYARPIIYDPFLLFCNPFFCIYNS